MVWAEWRGCTLMDRRVIEQVLELGGGERAAIATIVSTKGSTPRKAGAQILFYRDGRSVGTIGGGCGEAEVRQSAWKVMDLGQPGTVTVDLTNDIAGEDGMVCGGTMTVFIEPIIGDASIEE